MGGKWARTRELIPEGLLKESDSRNVAALAEYDKKNGWPPAKEKGTCVTSYWPTLALNGWGGPGGVFGGAQHAGEDRRLENSLRIGL